MVTWTYARTYARTYTISIDINKVGARSHSPQLYVRMYTYTYSTLQIQGIKQTRLHLNKTRLTARLHAFAENAFSVAFERV